MHTNFKINYARKKSVRNIIRYLWLSVVRRRRQYMIHCCRLLPKSSQFFARKFVHSVQFIAQTVMFVRFCRSAVAASPHSIRLVIRLQASRNIININTPNSRKFHRFASPNNSTWFPNRIDRIRRKHSFLFTLPSDIQVKLIIYLFLCRVQHCAE